MEWQWARGLSKGGMDDGKGSSKFQASIRLRPTTARQELQRNSKFQIPMGNGESCLCLEWNLETPHIVSHVFAMRKWRVRCLFSDMKYKTAVAFLCFASFWGHSGFAAPVVQFGEAYALHSKILNQDRPYWVSLPPSYQEKANRDRYPVLYLLDAEWNFDWVSEVVHFMNQSRQIPEFIVVGIPNAIDREHDLTPNHITNEPSSGGGRLFERFLNEELGREIDAKFRTVSYRILVGHSAGGALTADAFLRQTTGFQGYIAIDPALGWANLELIRDAEEFVPQTNSHAAIFVATAGWPLNQTNVMSRAQELFVSILKTNSSSGIRIGYEVEAEDHNSSRLPGLYNGLRFIFEGYKPVDTLVLNTPLLINEHFEQLSSRLGFQILPPERTVVEIGFAVLDAHQTNNAIECLKLNVSNYPRSAHAHQHLADAYLAIGEKELAIKNYKEALELDPNTDGVKEALAKLGEK